MDYHIVTVFTIQHLQDSTCWLLQLCEALAQTPGWGSFGKLHVGGNSTFEVSERGNFVFKEKLSAVEVPKIYVFPRILQPSFL